MKTKFIVFFILSFLTVDATINYVKKSNAKEEVSYIEDTSIKGIYISYLEYFTYFYGGGKTVNQAKIDKMLDNISAKKLNTIFLHVSPFSDSIYESKLFPYSYTLTGQEGKNPGFDYLDYFIKKAHQRKIKVHAWINPYRVSFDNHSKNISENNPAKKLIDTSSMKIDKNGIYYNPASEIVKNLILRQVEEIISKYSIDGIHFDDYFYMQSDIDKIEYEEYLKNGGKKELKEFRLDNTNDLIKRVYHTIKEKNKDIIFSIAPDGSINNNYLYHYADVKTWLKSDEYLDIVMPQIYYGFNNQYAPFNSVLDNWLKLKENDKVKIIPVLGLYKAGIVDNDAGMGKNEWVENNDIIKRQVEELRKRNINDYILFRYEFLNNENGRKEINNLLQE